MADTVGRAVALGLAQGGALSLALTLYALRIRTPDGAAQLSGMAQSAGYVIAASAPLLVGTVHDVGGGWTWPVIAMLVLIVPFTVFGWFISRPRYLEDEATPHGLVRRCRGVRIDPSYPSGWPRVGVAGRLRVR